VTFTFEPNLDSVVVNQHGKYLGQRLICSTVIVWIHTQTHKTDRYTWTINVVIIVPYQIFNWYTCP